jgi:pimeloyl-ACP methyl ester carboxylesterase
MWGIWARYFEGKGLPGGWIVKVMAPFWRYRAGVPFPTLNTAERVKEVRTPFLVIHGDQDQSVPVAHARILAEGAGVEPVILEGEGHNDILARPEVHRRVREFAEGVG